jgi:hypothetical protein
MSEPFQPQCKVSQLTEIEQQVVRYVILEKAKQIYQNLDRFRGLGLEKTAEVLEKYIDQGDAKLFWDEDDDTVDIKFFNSETEEYDI